MNPIHRRSFIERTSLGLALASGMHSLAFRPHAEEMKRRMTINLVPGAIGVRADQRESIRLAHKYRFESVGVNGGYIARLSATELTELKSWMEELGIQFGAAGLSVDFRNTEEAFQSGMKQLPDEAAGLKRAGVDRVGTWIMPCHDELTYIKNFRQHATRLREVCRVLIDHGIRFGMEYVGTQSLRLSRRYPFVHSMAETGDLIDAIGVSNCGYVLDTWHWWTAGDTIEDILALDQKSIVAVDLNDAPKGLSKAEVVDGRRELPVATGVIDTAGFLKALQTIGYDGPVRAEPFNQVLNAMENDEACETVSKSLHKAMALIRS